MNWPRKSIRQAGDGVMSVPQGDGSQTDGCGDPSAEDIATEHRAIAVKRTVAEESMQGESGFNGSSVPRVLIGVA